MSQNVYALFRSQPPLFRTVGPALGYHPKLAIRVTTLLRSQIILGSRLALGWRVLTAFWVTFKFCHADSILLVHWHHKRDVPSLITLGSKLLVPRPMQFYKEIP